MKSLIYEFFIPFQLVWTVSHVQYIITDPSKLDICLQSCMLSNVYAIPGIKIHNFYHPNILTFRVFVVSKVHYYELF